MLSFTLGLETSNFLRGIGLASGQIIGLSGVMDGLSRVARATWGAMERGGQLVDLSNRTGESVKNLYLLQEGFKQVGLGADSVAPMIKRLQMAMAGVDESGVKTDKLFAALGVNLESLKGMDTPKQFEVLAGAMSKLGKEQGTFVASKLFGREGGGAFMQLTRDFDGFKRSLKDSAGAAGVFDRAAGAFDDIGDTVAAIKAKVGGMFAGIAEGIAPALQSLVSFVDGVDWVGIGESVGAILNGLVKAFQNGYIWDVLLEGMGAVFSTLPDMAIAALARVGVEILKVIEKPLLALQSILQWIIEQAMEGIGKIPGIGSATGLKGFQARSANEVLDENLQNGGLSFFEEGLGLGDLEADAKQRMSDAMGKAKDRIGGLFGFLGEIGKSEYKPKAPTGGSEKQIDREEKMGPPKIEGNMLEKMGFVMNGPGAGGSDYARSTADNTKTMVDLLRKNNDLLKRGPGSDGFENIS